MAALDTPRRVPALGLVVLPADAYDDLQARVRAAEAVCRALIEEQRYDVQMTPGVFWGAHERLTRAVRAWFGRWGNA